MSVLSLFVAFLALLAIGDSALSGCGESLRRLGSPAAWGFRWVAGCGIVSVVLFGLLALGTPLDAASALVTVLGLASWPLHRSRRVDDVPREAPAGAVAKLLLALVFVQASTWLLVSAVSPLSGWDAWVNWGSKARVLFLDQRLGPSLHADVSRLATNLDYPLLLPLTDAFLYSAAGRVDERLASLVPALFALAVLALFHAAVRRRLSRTTAAGATAFLAILPRLDRLAPAGLADTVIAALVLLAFVVLSDLVDLERWSPRDVVVAGLVCGLPAWAKNEGVIWLGIAAVSFAGILFSRIWSCRTRPGPAIRSFALFLSVAVLPGGLWKFFLASHGTVRYVHSAVSWPVVLANVERLPAIATMSAGSLLDPRWSFVWLLVAVVFLLRRRRSLRSPDGWLLVPVASFLVLSAATFVFSRFDPWEPHLSNSIDRLALQAVPLAVWWLAAQGAAAGWLPGRESETTSSRP